MVNLKIGDKFPEMELEGTKGVIKVGGQQARNSVIYFYPKDNTPGCTQEAKDFTDLKEDFENAETEIIGISTDSVASHEKFVSKYEINFDLLADTDNALCKLCGISGKMTKMAKRTTFLVDKTGIIRNVWENVNVTGHAEEVMAMAEKL